jgi:hypothetical protein
VSEPGAETPAAGEGDEFVRAAAQFLADIVDQQIELAALAVDFGFNVRLETSLAIISVSIGTGI